MFYVMSVYYIGVVLVYIEIGIAILIAIFLFKKILSSSPSSAIKFEIFCKKCGYRTGGLKCPRCEDPSKKQRWR
ncbi:MAG: hypothetical protein EB158_07035 [Nitrosopumilaceae archaeon]|nr:hypothetical protein [Nitrososphaeria archaeon]NDF47927.1 hypothetical protein [Nitrosopumilaceae archaeon]